MYQQFLRGATRAAMVVFSLAAVAAQAPAQENRRPNVVVIISDDLGYGDLGVQGAKDIPTPHLDSIARDGTRFTSAYVTAPICGASRAGLLSGRYQQRHSFDGNPGASQGLSLKEATIANAFHDAGYATGAFGKWSVGAGPEFRPLQRGFDEYFGFLGMTHAYVPGAVDPALRMTGETPRPGWGGPNDASAQGFGAERAGRAGSATRPGAAATTRGGFAGGQGGIGASAGTFVRGNEEVTEEGYSTEAFAREAVSFIDRHHSSPFFLYLAFNASHSPLQPTKKYVDRFPNLSGKRQLYAATTSAMDDAVGEVLGKLRQVGQEQNTIVVYINDNGGPPNDIAASNLPLSGTKQTTWEGGIRVPLFVKWPAHLKAGAVRDEAVISLDLFPTLLAATGVEAPAGKQFDGVSILPLLRGEAQPELAKRQLFWRFNNLWAIREGNWKLAVPQRNVSTPVLFDLSSDLEENCDVAAEHPEIVQRLQAAWNAWNSQNLPVQQRQPATSPAAADAR